MQLINGKIPFKDDDVIATIKQIRTATGCPSVSCGVLHQGDVVFTYSEGFARVDTKAVPDQHTIYSIASMTKAFITALCGILVDEGVLSWWEPISTYLPEFRPVHDPEIGKRATLVDLCSHGTGLAPLDNSGTGFHFEFWNAGSDGLQKTLHLPPAYDFRSHFLYNNYMLDIVGAIISKVSGKRSGLVLRERILEPLGMTRTFTRNEEYGDDENTADGYAVLDNGAPLAFGPPALEDGSLQGASGYLRSSVHDVLIWANAVMEAEGCEEDEPTIWSTTGASGNPLKQMSRIRCAHRPIALGAQGYENSYGLGWFRHMLPSKYLASIGPNFTLLPDPPIINKEGPPVLTLAHWGEFGGYLSAFYTFPHSRSAVVVLANCDGSRGDPSDLIGQVLCQELFDMKPKVDFGEYARQASHNSSLRWNALVETWVKNRIVNTPLPALEDFTGDFVNTGLVITLHISKIDKNLVKNKTNPELLLLNINSLPRQTANLRHYHYDTWTFIPNSRDDAARKGMTGFLELPMLLLSFIRDDSGRVCRLEWDLQAGSCEGPAPGLGQKVLPIKFERLKE